MASNNFSLDNVDKLVAVFAHADDEAFGPAGTLAKLSDEGKGVHIVCVTDSDDKTVEERPDNLAEIRRKELQKSADILGVKKVHFLDYKDGELSNNIYHDIADDIEQVLDDIKPDTLMTFEHAGVSGHIDHIVCSMVTTFLFERLDYVNTILYQAITSDFTDEMDEYFIYFPEGYDKEDIDLIVDTSDYWDLKIKAMKAHESQVGDAEEILSIFEGRPKEDYFLVREK